MTDPYKLDLQRRAFDYRVDGWSHTRIGKVLGIGRITAADYIVLEGERRWAAANAPGALHTATEASIAVKEKIVKRMLSFLGSGDADKEAKCAVVALKAQEQIDTQRGIVQPKGSSDPAGATGGLAAIIGSLGNDTIMAVVQRFAEERGKPVLR